MADLKQTDHVMILRDHEIAELVNRLRDIAVQAQGAQQLRGPISSEIGKTIRNAEKNFTEWYNHG